MERLESVSVPLESGLDCSLILPMKHSKLMCLTPEVHLYETASAFVLLTFTAPKIVAKESDLSYWRLRGNGMNEALHPRRLPPAASHGARNHEPSC